MGSVSVALVNWNGLDYIGRCLEAVFAQTCPVDEVVLVDNASTDGSKEWVKASYPRVRLLENGANEGFAAGCNKAIAACNGAFVLVLNTDVFLEPQFVEEALGGFGGSGNLGAVTGCLFQEATGQWISGGFFLRRQIRIVPSLQLDREEEVFGATGAAVLFRREVLEGLRVDGEYFDATYFMYGEDIDLAWRLQLFGWKVLVRPGARGRHIGSGSLGGRMGFWQKPAHLQRHILKNRHLTLLKNAAFSTWLYLLPSLLVTEVLLWPLVLLRQPTRIVQLVLGCLDVVRLGPLMWRRRRYVQSRRQVADGYIRRFFVRF